MYVLFFIFIIFLWILNVWQLKVVSSTLLASYR
jgi:hypothetical protein